MPRALKASLLLPFLFLITGFLAFAESEPEEEDPDDPVLPLEEAMAAIDLIAPLPTTSKSATLDAISLILPEDTEPDYTYLRYLQIQERIEEKEALKAANNKIIIDNFFTDQRDAEICDPMKVLNHSEYLVLQDLVMSYSENAHNPIFVNLLIPDQLRILASIPYEKHESVLANAPNGILVYYFYDEPARTKVYFGKKTFDTIPYEQQKEFITTALKEATSQEDAYNSIYHHLLTLTADLNKFNDNRPANLITAIGADDTELPSHELSPLPKKRPTNLVPLTLLLILGAVFGCLYLLIKQRKPKQYHFPVTAHAPTFNFQVAKDTSQAIKFQQGNS